MTYPNTRTIRVDQIIYALRHLETEEYICLRHESLEYLACFSDGDTAFQFREELGLLEHVDITHMRLGDAPFDQFWLDGDMIDMAAVADEAPRQAA